MIEGKEAYGRLLKHERQREIHSRRTTDVITSLADGFSALPRKDLLDILREAEAHEAENDLRASMDRHFMMLKKELNSSGDINE